MTDDSIFEAVEFWCRNNSAAREVYGDIAYWDVSNVSSFIYLFATNPYPYDRYRAEMKTCNPEVGGWDTSAVTSMKGAFAGASHFNQSLANWVTSSVTDMSFMFENMLDFNQDISHFDTSSVTDMHYMFSSSMAFQSDLSTW